MFTYQLQERILKLESNTKIRFPSDFEIILELGPKDSFGSSTHSKQQFFLKGSKNGFTYNSNNGRFFFTPNPTLQSIQNSFEWDSEYKINILGNIVKIMGSTDSFNDINHLLNLFHYFSPILLNVNYPITPYVIRTSGKIGPVGFGWELKEEPLFWLKESKRDLKNNMKKSFTDFMVFSNGQNDRLGAALKYYYSACRLIDVGNTPNEFLAEVILNLSKSLFILFPKGSNNREIIRSNLANLGYNEKEVETKFIPLLLLRNHYDVGHEFLTLFETEEYNLLYEYLKYCKEDFRELYLRIIKLLSSGSFKLDQIESFELKNKQKKEWEKLKESFRKRIKLSFKNHIKEIIQYKAVIK